MDEDFDLRDFDGRVRLFPLPGVVLFPHAVLPLHVFEPRYRQMTRDALDTDRRIAIVRVRPDAVWSGTAEPEIEAVACLGTILNHERLADGRFNLLLHGRRRVRIVREIESTTLYRQAEVEVIEDLVPASPPSEASRRSALVELYREVAGQSDGIDPDLNAMLANDPPLGTVTDILASALGLPPSLKQALLADRRADRRADRLIEILRQVSRRLGAGQEPGPNRPSPPFSVN